MQRWPPGSPCRLGGTKVEASGEFGNEKLTLGQATVTLPALLQVQVSAQ